MHGRKWLSFFFHYVFVVGWALMSSCLQTMAGLLGLRPKELSARMDGPKATTFPLRRSQARPKCQAQSAPPKNSVQTAEISTRHEIVNPTANMFPTQEAIPLATPPLPEISLVHVIHDDMFLPFGGTGQWKGCPFSQYINLESLMPRALASER